MIRSWFATDDADGPTIAASWTVLGESIVAEVPGAAISADQLYREADLAIDFCEDVPPLPEEADRPHRCAV